MQKVPDYRQIEIPISLSNIKDQVAALLYASGSVHDNEDILDLDLSHQLTEELPAVLVVNVKLKKHQQIDLVKHD